MTLIFDVRLHSLLKAVETGSYTKAAKELSLTQPAVSQHIHSLEAELGVKIFEYTNNRLFITREGETVVKYATRILSLENNLRRRLADDKMQITVLSIGITHTSESNSIIGMLARYGEYRKNVKLKIISDTNENLCRMLKNYEIDMAVSEGTINDRALRSLPLASDSLVAVVPPGHPLAKRKSVTLEDLKNERLILRLSGSSTRSLFTAALSAKNLSLGDFDVVLEIDNVSAIKALVRQEMGVTILARSTCLADAAKKKLVLLPIEDCDMVREINIVHLKDFEHGDLADDILRFSREITDESPELGAT